MSEPAQPDEVVWQGRFITARKRGKWEYVSRARGIRAVVILAIDAENHVLLVEQFRVPLDRPCIELPAGLVGDSDAYADEDVLTAAARELEEETGYRAARLEAIGEFHSSPGMISESFTLVRAHDLAQVGPGGGTDNENITVHRTPLAALPAAIAQWRERGLAIDVRLLTLLGPTLLGPALLGPALVDPALP